MHFPVFRLPHSAFRILGVSLYFPVQIPLLIAAFDRLALVVFALALGQGDGQFDLAVFKIQFQRYEGMAFFVDLGRRAF